jgi:hypothetical protein
MPLHIDIDRFALGEISVADRHYLFLAEPASGRFVAAARYEVHPSYFECTNLVSDGYGPTVFLLLMQKARRDGLRGVAPDLRYNTDEAKRMDARLYFDALPAVGHVRNDDAHHPEVYLNQIYFLSEDVIAEGRARENYARSVGELSAARRQALVDRLEAYLYKSELPYQ